MKGKHVIIRKGSKVYTGTILSYSDWGTREVPDRYIEFMHDEKSDGHGYAYFKESLDNPDSIEIKGL